MNREFLDLKLKHLGLLPTVGHYVGRGLHRMAGLLVYRVLLVEPQDVRPPPPSDGVVLGPVDAERVRREALDPSSGVASSMADQDAGVPDTCHGAFVGDVLASHLFVASRRARVLGDVDVTFDPAWAFSRWAFTRAAFRGRHLHALVKADALRHHTRAGRNGLLSLVQVTNFESIRAASHVRCRTVGVVATWTLGGRRRVWASADCARYGLSLVVVPTRA